MRTSERSASTSASRSTKNVFARAISCSTRATSADSACGARRERRAPSGNAWRGRGARRPCNADTGTDLLVRRLDQLFGFSLEILHPDGVPERVRPPRCARWL